MKENAVERLEYVKRSKTRSKVIDSTVKVRVEVEVLTSPKLLSWAQLLDSSEAEAPETAEKSSLTSGRERQYEDDLHNSSMHLHANSNIR